MGQIKNIKLHIVTDIKLIQITVLSCQMDNDAEPACVYAFDSDDDICNLEEHNTNVCRVDQLKINDCISLDSYEDIDKRNPFVCNPAIKIGDGNDEFDEPSQEEMDAATAMCRQRRGSEFDVLAHDEIQSASIQDRSNNLYSTDLGGSCGGGRHNLIKLHLAKREHDFTDLKP